jgi:hypothetical protein
VDSSPEAPRPRVTPRAGPRVSSTKATLWPGSAGCQRHTWRMERGRDLVWDALVTTAERLNRSAIDTVEVSAFRRGLFRVTEGLNVGDLWVYVPPEPVRWRWRFSRHWHEAQPIQDAASKMGAFMRERPDLRGRP